jgi:hypothetical protein
MLKQVFSFTCRLVTPGAHRRQHETAAAEEKEEEEEVEVVVEEEEEEEHISSSSKIWVWVQLVLSACDVAAVGSVSK